MNAFKILLKNHVLTILAGLLAVVIPLYPKLPLFDLIPGYIVRVRIEDFLIFFAFAVWFYQVYKKKISWKNPVAIPILLYLLAGLLSTASGIFITKTIPFEIIHVGKSLLHYFRYFEYFTLVFIGYSAIRTKKDVRVLIATMVIALFAVFIYGVGQKHFYWPVYSTMNREFSKGIRLYLTEHARVQSTFGGHYDLGAYLVVLLPLVAAAGLVLKNKGYKFFSWMAFIGGLWLLMLSASRTSLFSYFAGIGVLILVLGLTHKGWQKRLRWMFTSSALVGTLTGVMLLAFGESMSERLLQTLAAYPTLNNAYHQANGERKAFFNDFLPEKYPVIGMLIRWDFTVEKPDNALSIDEVLVSSDERPVPAKPDDVYVDVPDYVKVATISAEGIEEIITIEVPRTYSQNAIEHGLSLAIRLDTLWPRALEGFYRNPLLGSGYATLTKESVEQFTEAESTDNNYLRTLGETGVLGFLTFYGAVVTVAWTAFKKLKSTNDDVTKVLASATVAATVGLMVNAVYIDVFAASKVAQSYWILAGFCLGAIAISEKKNVGKAR